MSGSVRIGTSGWVYKHWRERFYPPELRQNAWFDYFARHLDTVEINNSFYRLPTENAMLGWRRQAPAGFVYAVKASRYLTHMKKLKDPEEPIDNVVNRARVLGPHLGPLLYQLPPHWPYNGERFQHFLAALPRDLQHAVEFRELSWCNDEARGLLERYGVASCLHDMQGWPCSRWVTARFVFVRYHGPTQIKYAGSYDDDRLWKDAEQYADWARQGLDVYAYFNNDQAAYAVYNAMRLRDMVASLLPAAVASR
jgi:uncharacterized protein YecE (DUF72 family)